MVMWSSGSSSQRTCTPDSSAPWCGQPRLDHRRTRPSTTRPRVHRRTRSTTDDRQSELPRRPGTGAARRRVLRRALRAPADEPRGQDTPRRAPAARTTPPPRRRPPPGYPRRPPSRRTTRAVTPSRAATPRPGRLPRPGLPAAVVRAAPARRIRPAPRRRIRAGLPAGARRVRPAAGGQPGYGPGATTTTAVSPPRHAHDDYGRAEPRPAYPTRAATPIRAAIRRPGRLPGQGGYPTGGYGQAATAQAYGARLRTLRRSPQRRLRRARIRRARRTRV